MALPRVSDLKRFTQLSKQPFLLLACGVALWILNVMYGRWAGPTIDHELASVAVAFALVCLQALLSILSAYLLAMALSVFVLGISWRDQYLLPYTPPNPRDPEAYLARIGDKTLPFWSIVLAISLVSIALTHRASDNYFLQFPNRGFQLVSFRSESPLSQQRAMREIVRRDLARYLDPNDLRERMRVFLASEHPEVRAQAAWTAGRLQLISLEPDIRALMQHPDADVRAQAAIAEGQLRTADGIRALLSALSNETDEHALEAALVGIGLSRNPDASLKLSRTLHTLPSAVQPTGLWAIGESEALCAASAVLHFTQTEFPLEVRCAALESLKKIGTTEQLDALRAIYQAEDAWCELRVWHGRSSDPIKKDFYRIVTSAERTHEKAMDAIFNVAGPGLQDELAHIVNNTQAERLDRKHARRLYDLLDPAHPRTPREARNCPQGDAE